MENRRFDVFLSYNSDDRPVVERIAERLRRERLTPWWDRWDLVPGGQWQLELVEGLRASGACAVIVGPAGLGDWAREELAVAQDRAAKDRGFRIFMVLLPGAPEVDDPRLAFLRSRTWVDLRSGVGDADGMQDFVSAITGAARRGDVAVDDSDVCPYQGLAAFEEKHADFFFGREEDVAMIVEKLRASRFLAVLGPSGTGKSSLLRAGVVPALRRGALANSDSWTLRVFTPGPRPLITLAAQMARIFPDVAMQETLDHLREDERTLDMATSVALSERHTGDRMLLVVDQFEEVFTLCADEDERGAFVSNLLYAATIPGGRAIVILGMRADFYPRCAPYPELRALAADQQFLVGPLEAEGLRLAIEEPARRVAMEFESGLVETIVADVGNHPGALPLLEHMLLELWQRRKGAMLSLEAYVASGGVEGSLAKRANTIYASFTPAQQEIARRVLLRLVQPGEGSEDTRRRAEMGELVTSTQDDDDVDAVIMALADERLLTTGRDEVSGARVVNITHEALIRGWPELRGWINEDREALLTQRHLTGAAADWDRTGRSDDDLYAGARLAYWKEQSSDELTELERAFVAAGRGREVGQQAASRRRIRLALFGVLSAISAVAIVALVGLDRVAGQRDVATRQRNVAQSREIAAQSTSLLQVDPAQSLRLALHAFEVAPTQEADTALRRALSTPGARAAVLRGHEGPLGRAAFSPDGRQVVSAGEDGTVRVWDWAAGAERTVLRGHQESVYDAAFSVDGTLVVSAGADGTVRVWDWASGADPTVLRGHERPALSNISDPDGGGGVLSAAFSPDGKQVVSAGQDGTVRVWDWASGADPTVLRGHQGFVTSAAFSPDGKRVVSAGQDTTVRVWDWATGADPTVLRGHQGVFVTSAAFSPDGMRVVSAGGDGTVRVWDWASGAEPTVLRGHQGLVHSAAFGTDGQRVVSAGFDGTVRVWDWASGADVAVLRGHQGQVVSAAFSPDGKRVVSAGEDSTVRVSDWASGLDPTVVRRNRAGECGVALSPDGGRVVSSACAGGTVSVMNWASDADPTVLGGSQWVMAAAMSYDGQRVAAVDLDGTVRVWDLASGADPVVLRGPQAVNSVAFSPDGTRLVMASSDEVEPGRHLGTVRVWDWASGAEPVVLPGDEGIVNSAVFSPDGKRVVLARGDGTVRVWEWASGADPVVLRGNQGVVRSAAFSRDGNRVVSAGRDGTVLVWEWAKGADPVILRGHQADVWSAAFSPDGKLVVSAGGDGTVRVWEWASGAELTALRAELGFAGYSATFGPDGKRVVSAANDGTVRVWDCGACGSIDDVVALARSPLIP